MATLVGQNYFHHIGTHKVKELHNFSIILVTDMYIKILMNREAWSITKGVFL